MRVGTAIVEKATPINNSFNQRRLLLQNKSASLQVSDDTAFSRQPLQKSRFHACINRPFIPELDASDPSAAAIEMEHRIHQYFDKMKVFGINVKLYLETFTPLHVQA